MHIMTQAQFESGCDWSMGEAGPIIKVPYEKVRDLPEGLVLAKPPSFERVQELLKR